MQVGLKPESFALIAWVTTSNHQAWLVILFSPYRSKNSGSGPMATSADSSSSSKVAAGHKSPNELPAVEQNKRPFVRPFWLQTREGMGGPTKSFVLLVCWLVVLVKKPAQPTLGDSRCFIFLLDDQRSCLTQLDITPISLINKNRWLVVFDWPYRFAVMILDSTCH